MTLSISTKQNYLYVIFITLTAIGSVFAYRTTQQNWIVFREAEQKYIHKEYAAAIPLYQQSMKTKIPFSRIAVHLADSYVAIGRFKEAAILYREFLVDHPKDVYVHEELARVLSYTGNFEESEIEYKKVLEEIHEDHEIH